MKLIFILILNLFKIFSLELKVIIFLNKQISNKFSYFV